MSILFRELDEIIEELVSKNKNKAYEIVLIKHLNLIKSEIKITSMEQMETALRNSEPMAYNFEAIYKALKEMIEQNECYLAIKVSRVLMEFFGKTFQGIANLMCT